MAHQVRIVDVFTDKALAGNQLAVVLDGRAISDELMQRIAREMNFSETTFVLPPDNPEHAAKLRIFTPARELPFAGHPTIGTAWVLRDEGLVPNGATEFVLEEGVGPVGVRIDKETVWMTHPRVVFSDVFENRAAVAAALDLPEAALAPRIPIQIASTGVPFLYVALRTKADVDAALSDAERLGSLFEGRHEVAVFLFAVAGRNELYSRMFAGPLFDIREDPATGSASGPLGAFAVRYGLVDTAPTVTIRSEQGAKMGRQSFIHIELTYRGSAEIPDRIEVGGSVVSVLKGTLSDFS